MESRKRFYGPWKTPEDPEKCIEPVCPGEHPRQCKKSRGYGPGGLYCMHHASEKEPKPPRR